MIVLLKEINFIVRITHFFIFSDFTPDFDTYLVHEIRSSNPNTDFHYILSLVQERSL